MARRATPVLREKFSLVLNNLFRKKISTVYTHNRIFTEIYRKGITVPIKRQIVSYIKQIFYRHRIIMSVLHCNLLSCAGKNIFTVFSFNLKGQCHEIFDPLFFSPIDYT
jgi:hypothetical protein